MDPFEVSIAWVGSHMTAGTGHRHFREARLAGHHVGEEVEAFPDRETGLDERFTLGRSHGAGEQFVVARRLGALDAVEDRRPAQGHVGSHHQMGDAVTAPPRPETGPGVPETQSLLSHGHMPG